MLTSHRFFEFGNVALTGLDPDKRQTILAITFPCYFLFNLLKPLNRFGTIDTVKVNIGVSVFSPQLTSECFKKESAGIANAANQLIQRNLSDTMRIYNDIVSELLNPDDIIQVLPLGVYLDVVYKTDFDRIAGFLINTENLKFSGLAEFRFALASLLAEMLKNYP